MRKRGVSKIYDILIIGGGVAGLTAALYTARKGLSTAVVSENFGGQLVMAEHIQNFPGFSGSGYDLVAKVKEQAIQVGAAMIAGKVVKLDKAESKFRLTLSKGDVLEAKAAIIACGKIPRRLGIPGEDKFMGKGVHVCAICDAPLYKDKAAAVIGGGNSAVEAALNLLIYAKQVYLITRTDKCRADDISLKKLCASEKAEWVINHVPVEVLGDKFVNGLVVEDVNSKERRTLKVDGVFIEVGYAVNADIVKHLVKLNENNEIVVDGNCATSCEGMFAAGDATSTSFKQAIVSAGEGAKAALSAYAYLAKGTATRPDWGH
jgi:thioredoxin-disulfide reductase